MSALNLAPGNAEIAERAETVLRLMIELAYRRGLQTGIDAQAKGGSATLHASIDATAPIAEMTAHAMRILYPVVSFAAPSPCADPDIAAEARKALALYESGGAQ